MTRLKETREGNQKSDKLRKIQRKQGKVSETKRRKVEIPQSNQVEVKMPRKRVASDGTGDGKSKKSTKKKRKSAKRVDEEGAEQQDEEVIGRATKAEPRDHIPSSGGHSETDARRSSRTGKSKKAAKVKKKNRLLEPESAQDNTPEKREEASDDEVYQMSSGDEDYSRGMQKWIMQYHQSRPGIKVLQERIDDFITAHEAKEEQERKEKEAQAAEGGWTVVVHHKGRKKTTEAESGTAVGSVAQAAVLDKIAKKKNKEVGLDFYRFQKREAHRSEIMMLQSKFEQDKKRIQQMRAARKFRPY